VRKETVLHNALKFQYAGIDGNTEVKTGGYICDGITKTGEIIEVQTGSFAPLREKVKTLSVESKVRGIHPIILKKTIELFDKNGTLISTRKSPRKGSLWDVFKALLYAPDIALLPNVVIELAVVDVIESRVQDGRGSWRRKGVSIADKRLACQYPSVLLSNKADYRQFAPFAPGERFSVRDLAAKAGIKRGLAAKSLWTLVKIGVAEKVGKKGREGEYEVRE
jgi:hypothetical protein